MIYYAHTGGYTELGGIKDFLKKINGNLSYQRLFPARKKPPKLYKSKKSPGEIKREHQGITGKKLLGEIKKCIVKYRNEKDVKVLIIVDDGDCKIVNGKITKAIENFKKEFSSIKIIFLYIEPEIEKWFCIDKTWIQNKPCKSENNINSNLHSQLNSLLKNLNYEFNEESGSCNEKFSETFKKTLNQCGISYSKKHDGSEYLRKIDPIKIEKNENISFTKEAIRVIKNLRF